MSKAACTVCLLIAALAAHAQDADQTQPPVTILKVVTGLVAISAVVKSKDGQTQTGLTKDDFSLKQDGKEVPIQFFSRGSDLPLSIALMVDTSASQETFIDDESLASDVFFETMLGRPEDRAMLVQFDSNVMQMHSMTNSASKLHFALAKLQGQAAGGTLLYDAVYSVSKSILAPESGRRAMVILSDGGDNGSRHTLPEAIEAAQRADVQIYSILYSMHNTLTGGNTGKAPDVDLGRGALEKLSENTGGHVFTVSPRSSLREIYSEIGQDLRLQYELGYKPPPTTQPNSYHKLELKAKDKKLTVQARKGFFQPG